MEMKMAKIYQLEGETGPAKWLGEGEVIARRAPCEAYTVPTALIMKPIDDRYLVLFCLERKTGTYEWASWCDGGMTFDTPEAAREFARNWK